jgi:hypothetical protein
MCVCVCVCMCVRAVVRCQEVCNTRSLWIEDLKWRKISAI